MRHKVQLAYFFVLMATYAVCQEKPEGPQARILDSKHYSEVFGEERNIRIFLPPDYEQAKDKRYPVVYFFHGWGERSNKSARGYDTGGDYGVDNISAYVARHDLIVVKWDGYNPRTPGEAYPRPYNISPVETYRQFPLYFPELVNYVDRHFRTIPDREHRATAGLSMGGFSSFWVAGKYPHLVGSASNFMGSSEFYAGPNGFPSEYRHTELYGNYEGLRTRIVLGSKDFIRWYHTRMNKIWDYTRTNHEQEEFDWDHGTPGMGKTLDFHMAAFRNPLPKPAVWNHADVYPDFDVWGYSVSTDRHRPGFTVLENVSRSGFRSSVREWLPEGALQREVTLRIATDALYIPGRPYHITDVNLDNGEVKRGQQKADPDGRLHLMLDGCRHEIGIAESPRAVLSVANWRVLEQPWATAGQPTRLKLTIVNKGSASARVTGVIAESRNQKVSVTQASMKPRLLEPGQAAEASGEIVFHVQDAEREIVRLNVRLKDAQGAVSETPIDVPLFPPAPALTDFQIADGSKLQVWRRAVKREEKVLGSGNADGVVNPGETIAVGARDGDAFRLAELFTNDSCVDLRSRISDPWGDYDHVGATAKYSLPLIASNCPEGHEITFFSRYQLPNKPEHILKQGVVRIRVTGKDRTAPQVDWAQISPGNHLEMGIRDGASIRSAVARLENGNTRLVIPLRQETIFTGWIPSRAPGTYRLIVTATDEFGNSSETTVPGSFELKLPPSSPVDY